ncbi:MAG: siderophore-interacting protein [Psychromonas sp.]
MSKPVPRLLTVINSELLTTNMQRITFKADDISDFKGNSNGGYIKLLFNESGGTDISCVAIDSRPKMRTYTIRNYRQEKNEFDIDFVRHHELDSVHLENGGFASNWSQNAKIGNQISMVGPGSIKGLADDADWFFLVADMTALPALSEKLQALPFSATGYAVIEINHALDKQNLIKPKGIEVIWRIKSDSHDYHGNALVELVREQQWKEGRVAVWSACEFNQMRGLRSYFRNEKKVNKDDIYLSSYWKQGCTEDGHKLAKKNDKEAS